jgi:protoheme IX farnesyltransferase
MEKTFPIQEDKKASFFLKALGRFKIYWILVKDLQTALLMATALAGFMTGAFTPFTWKNLSLLLLTQFLTISGCTVLNMWFDRDIDAKMPRTVNRPIPSGLISARSSLILGLFFLLFGLGLAFWMKFLYGWIALLGVVLELGLYTLWLKRKTPLAVIVGGIAGGMPALGGRVLATGQVDWLGLLLAVGVLVWIPTHFMSFTIKFHEEYQQAGLPTFRGKYGLSFTRWVIALATILDVLVMTACGYLAGLPIMLIGGIAAAGLVMIGLVLANLIKNSLQLNLFLYKGASIFMLLVMVNIIVGRLFSLI